MYTSVAKYYSKFYTIVNIIVPFVTFYGNRENSTSLL